MTSRLSRRAAFDLEENEIARRTRIARASGRTLIDLTESNPTRAGFLAPPELIETLTSVEARNYDPNPRGRLETRQAIARDYAARGVTLSPENIVLTASSSESYAYLFKLLCDPGDEVLTPRPSYPLFEYLARLEGVRVQTYPLDFDSEWHLSVDRVRSLVTPRTRAIIVVHPNNPTGSFVAASEAKALLDLCAERDIALIADEVFADFALDSARADHHTTFASPSPALTFTLGGLSKSCALPQMKLGWIVTAGPEAVTREAVERLELIADTFLSVSTPIQLAAPGILDRKADLQAPILERLHANLRTLQSAVASVETLSLLPTHGGWTAVVRCPDVETDEARALRAIDCGLIVHPGHFFDFERGCHLVVSLLVDPKLFAGAMEPFIDVAR